MVEPYETTSYTLERAEYDAMVTSVSKYGGFYIARYEASKNSTTNKAQSIANQNPWNDISWGNPVEYPTSGAVYEARAVYPASSATTGSVVSTLPYGV